MNTVTQDTSTRFQPDHPRVVRLIRQLNSSFKTRLYFLWKLPTMTWWGVRVREVDHQRCKVTLPTGWRTQNPFRSAYFAAQCGAAELSTGLLAMIALEGRSLPVSMLVIRVDADFVKKATGLTTFSCEAGPELAAAVDRAVATGEGVTLTVESIGRQADGEVVSRVRITWSFKVKSRRK